ncbi:MAG TPA: hypothetical protein VFC44_22915 [Candidatus Saccharimonadales bacterium]|nr:hypothetical protein [Candidatus Saccharimonadales bacterium]
MAPPGPSPLLLAPFVLLLTAIAVGPLWFSTWRTRQYPKVVCLNYSFPFLLPMLLIVGWLFFRG